MRIAFSRPTSGSSEQRLLFERYRDAGYDGLQLKAGQYADWIEDPDRFLAEWGDDGAASALIAGGPLDAAGIDSLRRLIAFAAAAGSERIVFCHGVRRSDVSAADLRAFAGVLSDLGEEANAAGVGLSLHHHHDQPVMRRGDFDVFFGAARPGAVGLTIDTAHLAKSGVTDIQEVIRSFAAAIDNVHMKDYADGEFRVLGEGEIDFEPVFEALRAIGYDGWLCADEESGGELLAGMAACRRFLDRRVRGGATG